jgi:hypothetical protein
VQVRINFVLIDSENVKPEYIEKLKHEHFRVVVFVGANLKRLDFAIVNAVQSLGSNGSYVQISSHGPRVSLAQPADEIISRSKLGGCPLLPANFVWPPSKRRVLDFVLHVDLAELSEFEPSRLLTSSGLLTFFYDLENQPWVTTLRSWMDSASNWLKRIH